MMNMDGQRFSISNPHQIIPKMSVLLHLAIKKFTNLVITHHILSKRKLKKTDQSSQFILEILDTLRVKVGYGTNGVVWYPPEQP